MRCKRQRFIHHQVKNNIVPAVLSFLRDGITLTLGQGFLNGDIKGSQQTKGTSMSLNDLKYDKTRFKTQDLNLHLTFYLKSFSILYNLYLRTTILTVLENLDIWMNFKSVISWKSHENFNNEYELYTFGSCFYLTRLTLHLLFIVLNQIMHSLQINPMTLKLLMPCSI